MRPAPWRSLPQVDDDPAPGDRARPVLVSVHFLWAALRRHPVVLVVSPLLGLLLAASALFAFPPAHAAKASMVLPSDSSLDPTRAMATNVSLLQTDTLASRTTEALGLAMGAQAFNQTVTIQAEGNDLLTLTLTAPTDAEAVRRLQGLTTTFLAFRAEQLSFQSKVLIDGLQSRIQNLRDQITALNSQIDKESGATSASAARFQELVTQRAAFQSQVQTLQQQVEDETLKNSSLVASSRVLDQASAVPGRALKTLALGLASGLIGGTALGWGTVMFLAVTSDRLRRRSDVASVLGTSVRVSVGRIDPMWSLLGALPVLSKVQRVRARDRNRLTQALYAELIDPERTARLVVARADQNDDVSYAIADLARELKASGRDVTVVDVTDTASKVLRSALSLSDPAAPPVLRPEGTPALASASDELAAVGSWDGTATEAPQLGDVVITLADLDPAVGAAHLRSWADRAVVTMAAGGTSAERLRTVADQVRAAGLDLRFAVLHRTDKTDSSTGEPPAAPDEVPLPLLAALAGPAAIERFGAR